MGQVGTEARRRLLYRFGSARCGPDYRTPLASCRQDHTDMKLEKLLLCGLKASVKVRSRFSSRGTSAATGTIGQRFKSFIIG